MVCYVVLFQRLVVQWDLIRSFLSSFVVCLSFVLLLLCFFLFSVSLCENVVLSVVCVIVSSFCNCSLPVDW